MKNKFKVPVLDRHSFYILKNGLFLVIVMLAILWLRYNIIVSSADSEAVKFFFAIPLARLMLEHTLTTLTVVIGGALACDAIVKNKDEI